jgi:hypothetical protein
MADSLNVPEVRRVMKSTRFGETVFKALAAREQVRGTTDLRRLRYELRDDYGVDIEPEAFRSFFKSVSSLGLGKFIKGKGQNPDRFAWSRPSKETALEILGQKIVEAHAAPRPKAGSDTLNIPVPLPSGKMVYVTDVPVHMSKEDAEFLAEFIRKYGRG